MGAAGPGAQQQRDQAQLCQGDSDLRTFLLENNVIIGAKARPGDLRGVWPVSHSCIHEVSNININPILRMGLGGLSPLSTASPHLMIDQVGDVLEFRI